MHKNKRMRREQLITEIARALKQQALETKQNEVLNEGFQNWVQSGLIALAILLPTKLMDPSTAANIPSFIDKVEQLVDMMDENDVTAEDQSKILAVVSKNYVEENPEDSLDVYNAVLELGEGLPQLEIMLDSIPEISSAKDGEMEDLRYEPKRNYPIYSADELLKAFDRSGVRWFHLSNFATVYNREYGASMGVNASSVKREIKRNPDRFVITSTKLRDDANDPSYNATVVGFLIRSSSLVRANGGSDVVVPRYDAGPAGYLVH